MKSMARLMVTGVFSCALFFSGANVQAGFDTHGGSGVTCPNPADPKQDTIELLDSFEAKTLDKVSLPAESMAPEKVWEMGIERLDAYPILQAKLVALKNFWSRHLVDLDPGLRLLPIDDTAGRFIPIHCALKQVAAFDEAARAIWIDRNYFDRLSSRDQGVFWLHETLYVISRTGQMVPPGKANSYPVRRLIAQLLSSKRDDAAIRSWVDRIQLVHPVGIYTQDIHGLPGCAVELAADVPKGEIVIRPRSASMPCYTGQWQSISAQIPEYRYGFDPVSMVPQWIGGALPNLHLMPYLNYVPEKTYMIDLPALGYLGHSVPEYP